MAESVFASGIFACVYILLMETVGPKYRAVSGAMCNTFITIGHTILVLIAWAVPNWRNLTLTLYISQLCMFPVIWFLKESIRWYIGQGKFENAEKVLRDTARINGKELSAKTLTALKQSVNIEKRLNFERKKETLDEEPWLIVQVYRNKAMLLRCFISPVLWITLTLIYYGLTINSLSLTSGNKYSNFLIVALCDIPGIWIVVPLVDRIGRKPVLAGSYLICAIALIAHVSVPEGYRLFSLLFYMFGKSSISSVVTILFSYTSEIFPTKYRHRLFAFSSMMGRFGAIIAPLTPAFGGNIAFLMFAGFGLLSGLLMLLMPETLGCQLPDTMEEAENLGKRCASS